MSKNPLEAIYSAGSSPLKDYQNIINQPTMTDSIADAFIAQGQGNTLNQKQRYANAAKLGLGYGLKGAANSERASKLSSLENAAKQIAELDMSLKTSLGKKLSREAMLANVSSENYIDLKKINEMYGVGDYQGLNELVPAVYNSITQKYPEIASQTGTFSHVYGNNVYFNKNGKDYGINIKDAFEPFINTLPEENQKELQNLLSRTAKNKFTNSDIMTSLEIAGKRADVNLKQAHAGVYQQQANQIKNEVANPPMSEMDKFNYQETRKSNENFLKNLTEDVEKKDPDTKIKVLDKLETILNSGGAGIGNTPLARMERWTKETFGKDADIQEAKMLQKYFFPDIKGVAGNPNQREWTDLVTRIISGEQNIDAALEMIKFEKEQAKSLKDKYTNYRKAIIDTGNRLPYYHPDITSKVEQTVSNSISGQAGSENQSLPSDEELGIKFY